MLDVEGGCFNTLDFPEDRELNEKAFTDEGARGVIVELLTERYMVRVP